MTVRVRTGIEQLGLGLERFRARVRKLQMNDQDEAASSAGDGGRDSGWSLVTVRIRLQHWVGLGIGSYAGSQARRLIDLKAFA